MRKNEGILGPQDLAILLPIKFGTHKTVTAAIFLLSILLDRPLKGFCVGWQGHPGELQGVRGAGECARGGRVAVRM